MSEKSQGPGATSEGLEPWIRTIGSPCGLPGPLPTQVPHSGRELVDKLVDLLKERDAHKERADRAELERDEVKKVSGGLAAAVVNLRQLLNALPNETVEEAATRIAQERTDYLHALDTSRALCDEQRNALARERKAASEHEAKLAEEIEQLHQAFAAAKRDVAAMKLEAGDVALAAGRARMEERARIASWIFSKSNDEAYIDAGWVAKELRKDIEE